MITLSFSIETWLIEQGNSLVYRRDVCVSHTIASLATRLLDDALASKSKRIVPHAPIKIDNTNISL